MSVSRNRKNKARKAARSEEHKRLARLVKKGELPAFHLVKDKENDKFLERVKVGRFMKLSWRQAGTIRTLLK